MRREEYNQCTPHYEDNHTTRITTLLDHHMDSMETPLSQDTVFEILSNSRRRYVLYYLRQETEPIQLTTLAEHVAAWENETDVESLGDQERKRVYVSLYQTHIPKLAEIGLVEYDKEAGTVALADKGASMDKYLSESGDSIPWQLIYLTEAAVGALALLSTMFVDALSSLQMVVSLGILVLFAGTVAAQMVYQRRQGIAPEELQPNQ